MDVEGEVERAIADYTEAIQLNPRFVMHTTTVVWLGNQRGSKRRLRTTQRQLRLIQHLPRLITIAAGFGVRWASWIKRLPILIRPFNSTRLLRIFTDRGIVWRRKESSESALKDFEDSIRLNPQYTAGYRQLC